MPAKKAVAKATRKNIDRPAGASAKSRGKKAATRTTAAKKTTKAAKRSAGSKKVTAAKVKSKPAASKSAKSGPGAKKKPATRKTAKKAPRASRPKHLTPKVLRHLREKLLAKRRELIGAVTSSAGDRLEQQPDGTEDYIDYAVSSYDREFLLSLTELEQKELVLVEEALQRMDRKEYGRCLASGEVIPLKRLEVQPWARYTLHYQELVDQGAFSHESISRADIEQVADPLEAVLDDDGWDDDESDEDTDESDDEEEAGKRTKRVV